MSHDHKSPRAGGEDNLSARCQYWQKALLCVDIQYLGCVDGYGVFESHRKSGVSESDIQSYLSRINNLVVPNVARLQDHFRRRGHEVIHTRVQCLTADGRDRSLEHKRLELLAPPGSQLAQFIEGVAPLEDEIVINKTASGVFISTNIEYILRNLCVSHLYVVGVFTNECVSSAVRSASDLGFDVTLVEDGAAAITPELHQATLLTLKDRYARVCCTEDVIGQLSTAEAES